MKDLSAGISLTSLILTELGNTVKECEAEFSITAHNFAAAKGACRRNFLRLKFALGGEDKLKELLVSIETAKSNLWLPVGLGQSVGTE